MKRRDFFKSFSSIALLGTLPSALKAKNQKAEYNWKMVTTWPKNFPGLGTGAQYLADSINKLSGGRIKVTVYGAGLHITGRGKMIHSNFFLLFHLV